MSGLSRYVAVLRVFSEARNSWTVQEIADAVAVPASTAYRSVRELVAAGFLEAGTEARYRLGPAFVEFERLIRITDPLINAGSALLREISMQARVPCVAVLARLYGETVMCVAHAASEGATVQTSFERGRPMPLTEGATSKTILAQLSTRRLTKVLERAGQEPKPPFARTEAELRESLTAIRKRGYCITRGEVDKGRAGIAVPVAMAEAGIVASLSLVVDAASLDDAAERRLVLLLVSSAGLLSEDLRRQVAKAGTPERAVS